MSEQGRKSAKIAFIIIIIAIAAVVGYLCYIYFGTSGFGGDTSDYVIDDGTVYNGVSCMDVDFSGIEKDDVNAAAKKAAEDILSKVEVTFEVNGKNVTLDAKDMGAQIDYNAIAADIYAYGRQGVLSERIHNVREAENNGFVLDYDILVDKAKLKNTINKATENISDTAKDAELIIEKVADKETLTTDLLVTISEEKTGIDFDHDQLLSDVVARVADKNALFANEVIATNAVVTEPKVTKAELEDVYVKCGTFKTKFKDSASGRRFNVWKMSDIINGVVIQPGEEWSINEEAGPRTSARGWADAPGINEGQYKQEPGGGICQVSSTLYNTVLKCELEVTDRRGHSWPADYVPVGLDATISTGGPDFKFKNNFDTPIIIAVKCDAEEAREVEISIYRPKMDYEWDFFSDVISVTYSGAVQMIEDPTLAPGQQVQVIREHPRQVAEVYKQKLDLNGNKIGEAEFVYKDVYSNKPAIVRVGPLPPGAVPPAPAA